MSDDEIRDSSENPSSLPKHCKHWDCGWCYHPSNDYATGCVGIDNCNIIARSTEDKYE